MNIELSMCYDRAPVKKQLTLSDGPAMLSCRAFWLVCHRFCKRDRQAVGVQEHRQPDAFAGCHAAADRRHFEIRNTRQVSSLLASRSSVTVWVSDNQTGSEGSG
jgi:hypothetical protein